MARILALSFTSAFVYGIPILSILSEIPNGAGVGARGAYKLLREAVITAFEVLLAIRQLHLEQDDRVRKALEAHREEMAFAYALHLLRSEGCQATASFDRSMEKWICNSTYNLP